MYNRKLELKSLLKKGTFFLFGPRSTGKTFLIKSTLKNVVHFDLLDDDIYDEFLRRPTSIKEKIKNNIKVIVIDEIQKLPKLLDEVHRLIESDKYIFLLTGSSARKLRRDGANMLGGRAKEMQLFPLSWSEITDFNLLKYLNIGGLPRIYTSKEPYEELKAYVKTYLLEEIKAEAFVRNYERFVRFLEVMALSNGHELNYANLANDSGVPPRTIEGHIEVLKDTLMGFELLPFEKTKKRKAVTRSKFYFFDIGVANYLADKRSMTEGSSDLGICFEHLIINEVRSYLSYNRIDKKIYYWRTKESEVDLIIGNDLAIEIKFSKNIKPEHYQGLLKLEEEKLIKKYIVVGRFKSEGQIGNISYVPYEIFLKNLWHNKYF